MRGKSRGVREGGWEGNEWVGEASQAESAEAGQPPVFQEGATIAVDVSVVGGHENGLAAAEGPDEGGLGEEA